MGRRGGGFVLVLGEAVFAYRLWFRYLSQRLLPALEGRRWFRVDLFHIDSWDGWDTADGALLVCCCLCLCLPAALLLLAKYGGRPHRLGPMGAFLLNLLLVGALFAACFCLPWWMNAMNVLPQPRPGLHPILGKICCAQAYLFNRDSLARTVATMSNPAALPLQTDRFINNLTRAVRDVEGAPSYYSHPSLFQHFGFQTIIDMHDSLTKLSTSFERHCRDDISNDLLASTLHSGSPVIWESND